MCNESEGTAVKEGEKKCHLCISLSIYSVMATVQIAGAGLWGL